MRNPRTNPWLPVGLFLLAALAGLAVYKARKARRTVIDLPATTNSLGMKFVEVPAGTATMGSPEDEVNRDDDELAHQVEITRPFWLGVHEVTQEQYTKVMGSHPSAFTEANGRGGPDHPVENVSWDEAIEFCKRLSELPEERKGGRTYRLPTEAEWEYACRAGTTTPFGLGETLTTRDANIGGGQGTATHPVGHYDSNPWGLFDMHGNVCEWVQDWYDRDYYRYSPRQDPAGPARGEKKVVRGGSRSDVDNACRSANRTALPPSVRLGNGFRVVLIEGGKQE